jgi:hypothetical protein
VEAKVTDLDRNVVTRLRGSYGLEYEASVYVFWSDQPDGELSISGSIKDVGWLSYKTLSEFFSVAPDGTTGD